jgi:hypothetical protein
MPRYLAYIGYGAFVALGIYRWIAGPDLMDAGSAFGIALIFDPFAPTPWPARALWQRALLMVHVAVVFGLLGYGWAMS